MKNYIIYDGVNEQGPFTADQLKDVNITRTTPVRLPESNRWTTPDKIAELRPLVVPKRPIRTAADVIPVMRERVTTLHYRRPNALYGSLLAVALLTGIGIYSSKKFFDPRRWTVASNPGSAASAHAGTAGLSNLESDSADTEAKKPVNKSDTFAPQNWRDLITVQKSNYGYGVLGGISNLQVVASNQTEHEVDEVVAKLTYFKVNGKVWKTKLVTIKNIQPRSKKAVDVADVFRSKKVTVQLHKVRSKDMNLNYERK